MSYFTNTEQHKKTKKPGLNQKNVFFSVYYEKPVFCQPCKKYSILGTHTLHNIYYHVKMYQCTILYK